jgi:predicted RNA-binding protein YlqC (UPF0109 family)
VTKLLSFIVEKLGVEPGTYEIESAEEAGETVLKLRLPDQGLRRFDGREHRMARAIRQIFSAAAEAGGTKVRIEASPKA